MISLSLYCLHQALRLNVIISFRPTIITVIHFNDYYLLLVPSEEPASPPSFIPFLDCPVGAYLYSAGSQSCDGCPPGYSSAAGSTSCDQCPVETYSWPSLSLSPSFSSAPSNDLQLYYRFDSTSESSIGNIASGSVVYDATLQNGAVVSNNQLMLSAADSQYMSIGAVTTDERGLTFATWWRSDNSGIYARIFDFSTDDGQDSILLTNWVNGYLVGFISTGIGSGIGSGIGFLSSVKFNTQNAWDHVVWTLDPSDSGTWIVYVNGVSVWVLSMPYPASTLRFNNFLGRGNLSSLLEWRDQRFSHVQQSSLRGRSECPLHIHADNIYRRRSVFGI